MLKTKFIFHIQFRFTNFNQLNFSHTLGAKVGVHKLKAINYPFVNLT